MSLTFTIRITLGFTSSLLLLERKNVEVKTGREKAALLKLANELPNQWRLKDNLISAVRSHSPEGLRRNRYGLDTRVGVFTIQMDQTYPEIGDFV